MEGNEGKNMSYTIGMTADMLSECGIPLDQWTTLENIARLIILHGDSVISVSPRQKMFYFSSDGGVCPKCLLCKDLIGDLTGCSEDTVAPAGQMKYQMAGRWVLNAEEPTGIKTPDISIGRVHQVVFYDNIVAVLKAYAR